MMGWILLIGIIIVAVLFWNNSSGENTNQVASSSSQSAISQDFVNNSVQFFDGFLSLCDKYQVLGGAYLLQQGTETYAINAKLECKFYTIDEEHAEWFFSVRKIGWEKAKNEKNDPIDRIHAGEAYMRSVYGREDLHYAFIDIDEYIFGDPDVIISCDTSLLTMQGAKWEANLSAIEKELNQKWPTAKISVGKGGITVRAN